MRIKKRLKRLETTIGVLEELLNIELPTKYERDSVEETLQLLKDIYFITVYNTTPQGKRGELIKNVGNI